MPEKKIDVHYCFFRSWTAKVIDDDFPELNIFWHDYKWSPPNRKLFSKNEKLSYGGRILTTGSCDKDIHESLNANICLICGILSIRKHTIV